MKLGIIKDLSKTSMNYVRACEDLGIEYKIINIMESNWIDSINKSKCDGLLVAPNCTKSDWEVMYNERMYFINQNMGFKIYPSYEELFLYENKRNMAYWLEINNIPSAKTWVFYDKNEAINFASNHENYPIIFKPNVGSAAQGIKIIKNKKQAISLINKIFTKWKFYNRGYTKWTKSRYIISYPNMDDKQYNNILFQEKINVKHEWRGVKIGESYFAHKKLSDEKGFHSGSGKANYDNPPLEVMDFIKYACDIGKFQSMNVDFFESHDGNYYVNELQTIFGSKIQPYQMLVDGKPGRYLFINGNWEFEEGLFNQNNSYNLRVLDFIKNLKGESV